MTLFRIVALTTAGALLACGSSGANDAGGGATGGGSGGGTGGRDSGVSGGGTDAGSGGSADAGAIGDAGSDGGSSAFDAGDTIPNVTGLLAVPDNRKVTLAWTNPTGAIYSVLVKRSTGATAPATSSSGTLVYTGMASSVVDVNLENGTTYSYTVFTQNAQSRFSTGVSASATPSQTVTTNSLFHGYIEQSAYAVVANGSITFTGRPVDGTGPFTYTWKFGFGTPDTATGPGPHTIAFSGQGSREVSMSLFDTATSEEWKQTIFVVVATTDAGIAVESTAAEATVGQGGTLEVSGVGGQSASQWVIARDTTGLNGGNNGHINGDYVSFPWAGTFTTTAVGATETYTATGISVQSTTVVAEPVGSLSTGLRIGPLQGINGCYFCDAYRDNRIAVRLSGNGAGQFIAVYDQKAKAVDRDDSIIASVFNGTAWSPYADIDVSSSKLTSAIGLGEGNPEPMHQLAVAMASNGDAVAVFTQQAESPTPMKANPAPHVFGNVYRADGGWLGPQRLGQELDNDSNRTKEPKVVAWAEGPVTRALAVWQQNENGGPERLVSARYTSATNRWDAGVKIAPTSASTGGYDSFDLAIVPNGSKAFVVYEDTGKIYAITSPAADGGLWSDRETLMPSVRDRMFIDVEASANGTAMVLLAESDPFSMVMSPVYVAKHDGVAWGAPLQLGDDTALGPYMPPELGTTWGFTSVRHARLAMDASGNALAVFVPLAKSDTNVQVPVAVSAYYSVGSGSWSAWAPFTVTTSATDFEVVSEDFAHARDNDEIGLHLNNNGQAVVTYATSRNSLPRGLYKTQLVSRRFTASSNSWSTPVQVDAQPDELQGASRVMLNSNGGGMVVYENYPVNSKSAGSVKARQLVP